MGLEFVSLLDHGLAESASVLTRGFSDYTVRIAMSPAILAQMARVDSVDLGASRVFVREGRPVGAALLARRGWTARLAAMAIVPEARRSGVGRAAVARLLSEARERHERTMVLEVIATNVAAVTLYEAGGFKKVRRLVGFAGPGAADGNVPSGLTEVDLREMAEVVTHDGRRDLPWQISGETLAQLTPPHVAFRLDGSWIALTDPSVPVVTIRGLVTEHHVQGQGRAAALIRATMARFPGKEWRVSAIWPEELADVIEQAGLVRTELAQWQMEAPL
ncbi:MAG TPA: GNAT family N-acetyltransferase [Lacunisphaera sp.]|jgi:ribosomal protein S18 acetylase RimI-like enzyme|nr:GNAT family N-acetyltransferase [Lacunisphaera sp.]